MKKVFDKISGVVGAAGIIVLLAVTIALYCVGVDWARDFNGPLGVFFMVIPPVAIVAGVIVAISKFI